MKVKRKMQFFLCFLKCASKSLRSQSLNFPLFSCYFHRNIMSLLSIVCLHSQKIMSLQAIVCLHFQKIMSLQEKLCPSKPMFVYKTKFFFPPFYFHFPCYCFDFVIENGGCLKEGHKAADLGILVKRFSNENEGDRRLEQNK